MVQWLDGGACYPILQASRLRPTSTLTVYPPNIGVQLLMFCQPLMHPAGKQAEAKAVDKKMMAAVEQAFQQRFGMDAGWAHNVLFISGDCHCSGTGSALGLPSGVLLAAALLCMSAGRSPGPRLLLRWLLVQ